MPHKPVSPMRKSEEPALPMSDTPTPPKSRNPDLATIGEPASPLRHARARPPATAWGSVTESAEATGRKNPAEPAKAEPTARPDGDASAAPPSAAQTAIDIEAFSKNIARAVEEGGKALAAYMKPREDGRIKDGTAENVADLVKTFGHVAEYWLSDPQRTVEMQTRLGRSYLDLWAQAVHRMAGENVPPVAAPAASDRRFSDPEWSSNQFFDFLKQAYLVSTDWATRLVDEAQGLDPRTKHKAEFYMRQIANAVAPSNFVLTNPELLRETLASNAENLVRGMTMLTEDIEAGHGNLRIRQSDASMFAVGRNLAVTPGKVVFRNEIFELIQYAPTTEKVLKTPVVMVPPWINKYYILDLTAEKSFVRWAVAQGLTVFMVSWVNPDAKLAGKTFFDYMRDGIVKAIDVTREISGEEQTHVIGYCVGGTLTAVALAWLAAKREQGGRDPVKSATFFTAQTDFTHAGDLQVFVDEEQLASLEKDMNEKGYLEGGKMAAVFNLMRSNDLIWPYVINNYLKGKAPFPFDLLYWNSDSTRLPAANHAYYLRSCYIENRMTKGEMAVDGVKVDLANVKLPIYELATREDHIAPAKSVLLGSTFFGSDDVTFVLAGSGHIAGVVNPPAKQKYQHWTGPRPTAGDSVDGWVAKASEHPGSWWPHWVAWLKAQDGAEVDARAPGSDAYPPIEDAPGSYVKVRD
jgi:polyhydroxyalkanoate synthase subunit PhaC